MGLSDLRKRYETSPARLAGMAAANADIDRTIADNDARAARMASMGRNPSLEMSARRASERYFGQNPAMPRAGDMSPEADAARSARGIRALGTSSGAEAAAYARANPSLGGGSDVFGRNDRAAAMQRNQDFIRSGRASMFGPRPATTRGILKLREADLKGQELANQREANQMMAGNDRYKTSSLYNLRHQELNNAATNSQLKHEAEMAAIGAQNAETDATKELGFAKLEQNKKDSELKFMADKLKIRADIVGKAMDMQRAISDEQTRGIEDRLINDPRFIDYMKGNLAVKTGWDQKLSDQQNVMRVLKANPIAYGLAYLADVHKMNVTEIGAYSHDNTGQYDFDALFQSLEGGFGTYPA